MIRPNATDLIRYINEIHTYVLVAEELNFTNAANRLFISPTAVSKQVKLLEEAIGQELFVRSTRQVKLTEFGEYFYQYAKDILKEISNLQSFVHSQQTEPQGRLKIVGSPFTVKPLILSRYAEFQKKYPKIDLQIEVAERISDFKTEDVDILLGLSLSPLIPVDLKYRKLFTTSHILCASPAYLKKMGTPTSAKDLTQHKIINHNLRVPANVIVLQDESTVLTSKPAFLTNSHEQMIDLCVQGFGICWSAEFTVADYLKQGKLVQILPELPLKNDIDIMLFYRDANFEKPAVRAFIDFFVNNK